ncbi:MAG: hypothetical protein FWB90_07355 [Fibromonadales bacterium]|nr:hypothetical protein [Fibromonadales bacterium]
MNEILKIMLILGILVQTAFAQKILAVLEIVPNNETIELQISEYRHLTDELRTRAREALPRTGYSILTRDNIISLLPQDEEARECLAESCAVEIGRAIGAEYITQGFIGKFGEMMTLTVELYESMSGNLLGSFVTESKDIMGLLATIRQKAPELFSHLKTSGVEISGELKVESGELKIQETQENNSQLSTLNSQLKKDSQLEKKSKTPFYIALSLDLLGAAALGFGIYQHINANSLHDDYKKMQQGQPQKEYDSALKKANDAQQMRNIGLSVGGALVAAGIAVHIWF